MVQVAETQDFARRVDRRQCRPNASDFARKSSYAKETSLVRRLTGLYQVLKCTEILAAVIGTVLHSMQNGQSVQDYEAISMHCIGW